MPFSIQPPPVTIGLYRKIAASLWFAPALYAAGGLLLAYLLVEGGRRLPEPLLELFLKSKPDTVKDVLQLLASSTLTVTTIAFSVLMVVLTMTASNFSPRALTGYLRDRINQNTLGVFIGGFAFSAAGIVLMQLRSYDERVLGLFMLATLAVSFLALGALVYFIHYTANAVQITNLVVRWHREADAALARFLALSETEKQQPQTPPALPSVSPGAVNARTAGYIQVLDRDRVFGLAVDHDLVVRVLQPAGGFAARGVPLCEVWPAGSLSPELADGIHTAFAIGAERTAEADPLLKMELLTEVAIRALSPGINDPNTAVNCLHYLCDLLVRIARHQLPRQVLYDDDGAVRLVIASPGFRDFLESSLLGIASAGAGHARVALTLLGILHDLASVTPDPERRAVIEKTAYTIADLAFEQLSFEREREQVRDAVERLALTA